MRLILHDRHRFGYSGAAAISSASALRRHRRASRRWSRRGLLHDGSSDDLLVPQVWRILPGDWRRQGALIRILVTSELTWCRVGHWAWKRKELRRQLPASRRNRRLCLQERLRARHLADHAVVPTFGDRAPVRRRFAFGRSIGDVQFIDEGTCELRSVHQVVQSAAVAVGRWRVHDSECIEDLGFRDWIGGRAGIGR